MGPDINILDTLIIGAGPAGLTAATYLGRFRRPTIVIDGNASRARWIPASHNTPGFPQGIAGSDLLEQLRVQAVRYGAEIRRGQVVSLLSGSDYFTIRTAEETFLARYVLLATGVRDHLPALAGTDEALLRSLMRVCPICDAFEASGRSIAVISDGPRGEREAEFLKTYSDRITLLHVGGTRSTTKPADRVDVGIEVIESSLDALEIRENELVLRQDSGVSRTFEVCYCALGCTPQDSLAAELGARLDAAKALTVNEHQQTSVPRLYAAGDVVRGLNQIAVAAGEAAIAATDIHNKLRAA
jgi:thioredoxin reductase (NADPH)